MKKIIAIVIIISICFLTACQISKYPAELRNKVSEQDEKAKEIEYNGQRYKQSNPMIFNVAQSIGCNTVPYKDDVIISWNKISLTFVCVYYAENKKNPLFIYETHLGMVYLKDNYDFKDEVFILEGTDAEISYSEALYRISTDEKEEFYSPLTYCKTDNDNIVLYSKKHARLRIEMKIYSNKQNFIGVVTTRSGNVYFILSDKLVQLLKDKKIILQ